MTVVMSDSRFLLRPNSGQNILVLGRKFQLIMQGRGLSLMWFTGEEPHMQPAL